MHNASINATFVLGGLLGSLPGKLFEHAPRRNETNGFGTHGRCHVTAAGDLRNAPLCRHALENIAYIFTRALASPPRKQSGCRATSRRCGLKRCFCG